MDSADRQESDPSLSDFYHDMNEHSGAEYKKVGSNFVAELDSNPTGWQVTLWKAVKHSTREGYAPPIQGRPGIRYAWDAVGRAEFEDRDDARAEYQQLGSRNARAFTKEHPYNGPRRSYSERLEAAEEHGEL